ncbi:TetR/AcrR family transcriptional regulator [Pseudalkalibacillus caeni]|uniref:TetR/AcrR family transcriptional regulator n=1 Tax=Exobacillus caeni TaxID=2574798 RepID=A0A5R9F424_9BACL|nr:TetR/AcrR family transcriptional regulator [Pseudalkalibacillus caeni]TLS37249.1 TetR/AcrR family transcriptional regulator [Pseudalkalibacillus caeni]
MEVQTSQNTADKIKAVSLSLFARKGFEGTSLAEIASRVGIKKPSLYAHFKNKEDIFLAVIDKVMADYIAYFETVANKLVNRQAEEKLFILLKENTDYLRDEELGLIWKRMMLFPHETLKEKLKEKFLASEEKMTGTILAILKELKEDGIIQENTEEVLDAYYCLMDGTFEQVFYYPEIEHKRRLQHSWQVFWKGIKR